MTRRALFSFFALTFAIAWGVPGLALFLAAKTGAFQPDFTEFTPLSYVSLWAPAISAVLVIGMGHGWAGVVRYLRGIVRPTGTGTLYLAVALGIPLVNLLAAAGMHGLGRDAMTWPAMTLTAFATLSLLRFTEGPMEELGWRGFALPLLQRRFSGLGASLILGSVWALWHVPAFVVGRSVGGGLSGSMQYVLGMFFLGVLAQSVLLTVAYNATRGSVPVAILFHWMTNLPYPWETGLDLSPVATPLWVAVAVGVGATVGRKYLGRDHRCTEVAPGLFRTAGEQASRLATET